AGFDERPAASQVGEVVDERARDCRRVVDADPGGGPLVVRNAAHCGQLVAQAPTPVRAERQRADRPEAGAAARATDLLSRAEQDRAEHTVGDDLVLLRLRYGVD